MDLSAAKIDSNNPTAVRLTTQSQTISTEIAGLVARADGKPENAITSAKEFEQAGEWVKASREAIKAGKALVAPAKQKLQEATKDLRELERKLIGPWEAVDELLNKMLGGWNDREARRKRDEEDRLLRESLKQAEDEVLDRAAGLQNLANVTGDEHFAKAAEEVLNGPVVPHVPAMVADSPKVQGVHFTKPKPDGVIVKDIKALARAVADGKVDPQALMANERWLKGEAKQRGEAFNIPGVAVTWSSSRPVVRT